MFVELILHVRAFAKYRLISRTLQALIIVGGIASFSALAQNSPCDLNNDGKVDQADWQLAVDMHAGKKTCTANIMGAGVCNFFVVQRVAYAGQPGGSCVTGTGHSASLTWAASTSTGVVGYNVYQRTSSGGSDVLLNSTPVSALTFVDSTVQGGKTYYYVVKAVAGDGSLSAATSEVLAAIPAP